MRAIALPLPLFHLRLLLVDDVQPAFAPHNLAVLAAALDGSCDFHGGCPSVRAQRPHGASEGEGKVYHKREPVQLLFDAILRQPLSKAALAASSRASVKTKMQLSQQAMVCSKCAASEPSVVICVHLSAA